MLLQIFHFFHLHIHKDENTPPTITIALEAADGIVKITSQYCNENVILISFRIPFKLDLLKFMI